MKSGRGAHYVPQVKDVDKREIAFTVVPSNLGKKGKERSYSARLTHNQVLDEEAVVSEMCGEFNLPKNRVVQNIQQISDYLVARIRKGYQVTFGGFTVGLAISGKFDAMNAEFDPKKNKIEVVVSPRYELKDAVAYLKPVNETKNTAWPELDVITCEGVKYVKGENRIAAGKVCHLRRIRRDGDAHYHLMSRTNDRRFLFSKGRVKGEIVSLLRRAAAFSGVRLEAWCVMDNHFHVVCEVTKPADPVPEAEVVRRIGILKGERFAAELAGHWADLRSCGMDSVADAALNGWRARMHDVSQFAKTFKELVSISYKAHLRTSAERVSDGEPNYYGSIWSGRFKSTLVEDGRYLATCIRYVELNPVRAGMVSQAKNYAYSSANEPKPNEINGSAGCVPDAALLRRVAQVGNGKIFGGYVFVMRAIFGFGVCFAGHPTPRPVFAGVSQGVSPLEAYASHGWRRAG